MTSNTEKRTDAFAPVSRSVMRDVPIHPKHKVSAAKKTAPSPRSRIVVSRRSIALSNPSAQEWLGEGNV